jgi:hypothetical protein
MASKTTFIEDVKSLFLTACKLYNGGQLHYDACKAVFYRAHMKLSTNAAYGHYGDFAGQPRVPYNVFSLDNPRVVSRPVRPDLYISDTNEVIALHDRFITSLKAGPEAWTEEQRAIANRMVYTAVLSFACCYDLWQRGSRKSPGTFFEILVAGTLQVMLPHAVLTKHIPLAALVPDTEVREASAESETEPASVEPNGDEEAPEEPKPDEGSGVSTDLVLRLENSPGGIVVPLKITTRERIVQPFAHQRILDAAFGEGVYKSLLTCISETQLDEGTQTVKQVCVPGTVKLFQKYLARIDGIYYCDIPQRYASEDMKHTVSVKSVGEFFSDVASVLKQHGSR